MHLRGPVPLRDPPAERRAVERLRTDLDLLPGRRTNYAGADAPRFVEKLKRWRGDLSGGAAGVVKPAAALEPRLSLTTDGDAAAGTEAVRFDLTFTTKSGASVGADAVVRAWEEGLGIVPLTGRRLGVVAARLDAEARTARGRSAGRAPGRRASGAACAAGAGGALHRARPSAAAGPRSAGAADRRVRTPARGAAAGRSDGHAASVSAAGGELAVVPAQRRPGRHPGRRHGPREDAAGDVHVRRRAGKHAGRRADQRDLQLAGRAGALSSRRSRSASITARTARSIPRPT